MCVSVTAYLLRAVWRNGWKSFRHDQRQVRINSTVWFNMQWLHHYDIITSSRMQNDVKLRPEMRRK